MCRNCKYGAITEWWQGCGVSAVIWCKLNECYIDHSQEADDCFEEDE